MFTNISPTSKYCIIAHRCGRDMAIIIKHFFQLSMFQWIFAELWAFLSWCRNWIRFRGDCFGYKIAVQIESLQIFHLPQNIGTLATFYIEFMSVYEWIPLYIAIRLQNNSGLNYFQEIFYVKTVYVSGVRYWETLYLCTNSCILAHCMLNKKIFVSDIELFIFLSLSYCPWVNIKKIRTHTKYTKWHLSCIFTLVSWPGY